MTYTDNKLEEMAGMYANLPIGMQEAVTFEQFCAAPGHYIKEATFQQLKANPMYCGDCEFFDEMEKKQVEADGASCECTGNAQSCMRLLP